MPTPSNDPDRVKILAETYRLLSIAVDALAKTSEVQTDDYVKGLLVNANNRLWEARYWLAEATGYLDKKLEEEDKGDVKGN